jgi:hypothetical protein
VTVTHPQRGDTRLIFIFIKKIIIKKKKKEEVKTHSRIEEEEKKKDNIFVFKLTPNLENCGIYLECYNGGVFLSFYILRRQKYSSTVTN